MVETQCGVDIIDVLQKGKEVLHFFKRDSLCVREKLEYAKMIPTTKAIHYIAFFYDKSGHAAPVNKNR